MVEATSWNMDFGLQFYLFSNFEIVWQDSRAPTFELLLASIDCQFCMSVVHGFVRASAEVLGSTAFLLCFSRLYTGCRGLMGCG